ncbi:two-component system, chemotaxis family, CheB/CheR fusion protein [Tranquillimonas rosea]|uniref:Two-component system, chemotaxis family, CheB/CheR fusion protein n=1 Tax=Tranquillimonas rosea TaxID=641238 RepID=A0A1H9RET6_9RHOB|nr:CheR family methyltransferase [Tranquillimonas rosea]SER70483.1 two-component system, chemotaxis family, CheB/CheR fusion protein [Tranquillimonas rosea]
MKDTDDLGRVCIVGVGASAGGLEAIREMLTTAQRESQLAYVVIQHLDPNHESMLAELLGRHTEMTVLQASGGEKVEAGNVYIIPPGHGLSINDGVLQLTDFAQPRGLRRPIDDFFESLASDQGRFAACVILSGTGADGSTGLRAIKEKGGLSIAQDPETARYDGMPLSAEGTGLVDFIRAPVEIVECIETFYAHRAMAESDDGLKRTVAESIDDISQTLRRTIGHDFSGYKRSTLVRRIERRIQVLNLGSAWEYLRRLEADREECETLFRELLINVTRFFRDPEHFDELRDHAVTPLVRDAAGDEVRVWVPGCSSGEEAYSLAMMFADEVRRQRKSIKIQIFATDIDEQMLKIARNGVYPLAALPAIPEDMRDSYTIGREGSFQITAQIRDMVRFSSHSVIKDPPFSKIDLVSCRNLLIYLGERLQTTALPVFHYSIRPRGYLFLGPSESIGRFENLFEVVDQRARLFRRNNAKPIYPSGLRPVSSTERPAPSTSSSREADNSTQVDWTQGIASDRILQTHAPPTLQVGHGGEILASYGRLTKYLSLDPVNRENDIVQTLARPGLRDAISALLREAVKRGKPTVARDLRAGSEFGEQALDLVADPLPDESILLVFRDRGPFEPNESDVVDIEESDSHVQQLEEELRVTRGRLRTTVEELETANEELKSSNEEMMSMNEELQSTNEELSTVNDELKSKVDQLQVANADLQNFFDSTALPLLVLDKDRTIRNFTEAASLIFPLRPGDRGRPIDDVQSILEDHGAVRQAVEQVIRDEEPTQMRVMDRDRTRTWSLLVTPYRTGEGEVEGATLVFTDITDALAMERALEEESARLRLALDVARLGVWEYDVSSGLVELDRSEAEMFGLRPADKPGEAESDEHSVRGLLDMVHPDDADTVNESLRLAISGEADFEATFRVETAGGEQRTLRGLGRLIDGTGRGRLLGVTYDVTMEREAARVREVMLSEMNHRVKNLFSIITGMLRIAGRTAETPREVVDNVERRISALARSHDMTQRGVRGEPITLKRALQAALEPYEGTAPVTTDGPDVALTPKETTSIGLLLHEWATNASKYGVLGPVEGRLDVTWTLDDDGQVTLHWNEIYATEFSQEEAGSGFGSTLVEVSATQLGGEVEVEKDGSQRRITLTYTPDVPHD